MNKEALLTEIRACHASGKKLAVSFCSHVPMEVLEAAGICGWRLPLIDEMSDQYPGMLPKNLCPTVRSVCALCEDPVMEEVDLIITESSCDGKKKMYELLHRQERLHYYQVIQGAERDYAKPLIVSEIRCLIRELERRYGVTVTEEALRDASGLLNEERSEMMRLLEIQKSCPPAAYGMEVYEALEDARSVSDRKTRIERTRAQRQRLLASGNRPSEDALRILITGCPIGGAYRKVIRAIEENGGVAVCFENCEAVKTDLRHVDTDAPDIIDAIAECYLHTPCAIMESNSLRFRSLEQLVRDYQADGVIDIALSTCHAYTVEKFKVQRFMKEHGIPYYYLETDDTDQDAAQLTTRISAFLEML